MYGPDGGNGRPQSPVKTATSDGKLADIESNSKLATNDHTFYDDQL